MRLAGCRDRVPDDLGQPERRRDRLAGALAHHCVGDPPGEPFFSVVAQYPREPVRRIGVDDLGRRQQALSDPCACQAAHPARTRSRGQGRPAEVRKPRGRTGRPGHCRDRGRPGSRRSGRRWHGRAVPGSAQRRARALIPRWPPRRRRCRSRSGPGWSPSSARVWPARPSVASTRTAPGAPSAGSEDRANTVRHDRHMRCRQVHRRPLPPGRALPGTCSPCPARSPSADLATVRVRLTPGKGRQPGDPSARGWRPRRALDSGMRRPAGNSGTSRYPGPLTGPLAAPPAMRQKMRLPAARGRPPRRPRPRSPAGYSLRSRRSHAAARHTRAAPAGW